MDSEPIAVRVDAVVLARLGWPLAEAEIVERFVGRSHEFMVSEIEAQLGRPRPERFAGRIFSASDVRNGKPAPDLFIHAAASMQVDPIDAVVVEDSPFGVEAARAAGMRVLGYAGGLTPVDRLANATVVFTDMRRLPGLLAP